MRFREWARRAVRGLHAPAAALAVMMLAVGGCESSSVVGGTADGGMDAATDVTCPSGQAACMGACVDTRASAQHCGACGNACAAGQVCVNGACMQSCPGTQTLCNNSVCVSTATDREHCGACGNVCPGGQVCSNGMCQVTCASNLQTCTRGAGDAGADAGGERYCADPMTDRNNCGGCGNVCPSGRICERGECVVSCVEGQVSCGGACRDL